jgi:hypothetical protein
MSRVVGVVVAIVLAMAAAGCGDDGAGAPTTTATPPTAVGTPGTAGADDCAGCRRLGVGTDADIDGTSVGVRQCADGSCELALAASDGAESEVHVVTGDTLDVGAGWVVVAVTGDGLTIRPT